MTDMTISEAFETLGESGPPDLAQMSIHELVREGARVCHLPFRNDHQGDAIADISCYFQEEALKRDPATLEDYRALLILAAEFAGCDTGQGFSRFNAARSQEHYRALFPSVD